jgi:5'-3' exonuclease
VYGKYGVPPCDIDKLLAIAGDPGDCVHGVRGFGPVKAVKLLRGGYITKSRIREVFNDEQVEQFLKSWTLVRLGHMKCEIVDRDVVYQEMDEMELEEMLAIMEFRKFTVDELKKLYSQEMYNNGLTER